MHFAFGIIPFIAIQVILASTSGNGNGSKLTQKTLNPEKVSGNIFSETHPNSDMKDTENLSDSLEKYRLNYETLQKIPNEIDKNNGREMVEKTLKLMEPFRALIYHVFMMGTLSLRNFCKKNKIKRM